MKNKGYESLFSLGGGGDGGKGVLWEMCKW